MMIYHKGACSHHGFIYVDRYYERVINRLQVDENHSTEEYGRNAIQDRGQLRGSLPG
jgi:hypothetical protein